MVSLDSMPQGLSYPVYSFNFSGDSGAIVFEAKRGYPLRPDWRLDAHDSGSWLLGELKKVCEVEQFTDYQPQIFETVCQFDTRMNAW